MIHSGKSIFPAQQVLLLALTYFYRNPFIEMQAVDRVHRIGQQKHVRVYQILFKNTIEDRIIEMLNQKRQLFEVALEEKASQGLGRLGRQELIYLFNGGDTELETARRTLYEELISSPAGSYSRSVEIYTTSVRWPT